MRPSFPVAAACRSRASGIGATDVQTKGGSGGRAPTAAGSESVARRGVSARHAQQRSARSVTNAVGFMILPVFQRPLDIARYALVGDPNQMVSASTSPV